MEDVYGIIKDLARRCFVRAVAKRKEDEQFPKLAKQEEEQLNQHTSAKADLVWDPLDTLKQSDGFTSRLTVNRSCVSHYTLPTCSSLPENGAAVSDKVQGKFHATTTCTLKYESHHEKSEVNFESMCSQSGDHDDIMEVITVTDEEDSLQISVECRSGYDSPHQAGFPSSSIAENDQDLLCSIRKEQFKGLKQSILCSYNEDCEVVTFSEQENCEFSTGMLQDASQCCEERVKEVSNSKNGSLQSSNARDRDISTRRKACGVGTPIICMPEDRTDLVGEILGPCVNDSKESECGRSDYPASMENHSPTHVDESKMDDQWDRLRSVETSNVSGKRKVSYCGLSKKRGAMSVSNVLSDFSVRDSSSYHPCKSNEVEFSNEVKAKRATCRKSKMMTISKKVPCLSTREEFLSATLNVKSLQIGELYLQGYVETMLNDDELKIVFNINDRGGKLKLKFDEVEQWKEHFGEETNVIAILLKEMKAKQLHNYLIGLLEDQKFHYSSKSPVLSERYIVMRVEPSCDLYNIHEILGKKVMEMRLTSTYAVKITVKDISLLHVPNGKSQLQNLIRKETLVSFLITTKIFLEEAESLKCGAKVVAELSTSKKMCEKDPKETRSFTAVMQSISTRTRSAARQSSTCPSFSKLVRKVSPEKILLVYKPPESRLHLEVTGMDIDCLEEGNYLNDKIIDFYLMYLWHEKFKHSRERVHVFNSFFHNRLTDDSRDIAKEKLRTPEKLHSRVKTWTRHVDIFSKEYIILPICLRAHWFLVVVCYPGNHHSQEAASAVPTSKRRKKEHADVHAPGSAVSIEGSSPILVKDIPEASFSVESENPFTDDITELTDHRRIVSADSEVTETRHQDSTGDGGGSSQHVAVATELEEIVDGERKRVATNEKERSRILVLDSLGVRRVACINKIKSYLTVEWLTKHPHLPSRSFKNLPYKFPKVPLQDNSSDCGVYLLQYVEALLERIENNMPLPTCESDWGSHYLIKKKRDDIREQILQLSKTEQDSKQ